MTVIRARSVLLVASFFAASTSPVAALDPDKRISQFTRTVWEARDGLPMNTVQAVVQTRDGYVWLGTEEGLVRFDGDRFEVFDRNNTPGLPGKDVTSLFESTDGSLWIGMDGGLGRLKDGQFAPHPLGRVVHEGIVAMASDRAGNLWLGTLGGGLLRTRDGRSTTFTSHDGLPDNVVLAVAETRDGNIWIGTTSGLAKMTGDRMVTLTFTAPASVRFKYRLHAPTFRPAPTSSRSRRRTGTGSGTSRARRCASGSSLTSTRRFRFTSRSASPSSSPSAASSGSASTGCGSKERTWSELSPSARTPCGRK